MLGSKLFIEPSPYRFPFVSLHENVVILFKVGYEHFLSDSFNSWFFYHLIIQRYMHSSWSESRVAIKITNHDRLKAKLKKYFKVVVQLHHSRFRTLSPGERASSTQFPFDKLVGPQNRSGRSREEKNFATTGTRTPTFLPSSR
jgi:hypothetical protein